jgi:hypothetical protein
MGLDGCWSADEVGVPVLLKNLLTHNSIDDRWQGLRNALAGLFCASLGTIDEQRTTSPTHSYFPQGILPSWNGSSVHELRHGSMPSEHVCTENLTPFLKLLPCKSLSGIASLLNPHRIFDADWHGLGIHVLWLGESGIKVRLAFQSVTDPLRASSSQKRGKFSLYFMDPLLMEVRLVSAIIIWPLHREDLSSSKF